MLYRLVSVLVGRKVEKFKVRKRRRTHLYAFYANPCEIFKYKGNNTKASHNTQLYNIHELHLPFKMYIYIYIKLDLH